MARKKLAPRKETNGDFPILAELMAIVAVVLTILLGISD